MGPPILAKVQPRPASASNQTGLWHIYVCVQIENVRMLDRLDSTKPPLKGCLYLTATHLIFVDPDNHKELWVSFVSLRPGWLMSRCCRVAQILHMHIASVQKLPITTLGSPIQLRCKNFLCVTFQIPKERDAMQIYESLLEMSQPNMWCTYSKSIRILLPTMLSSWPVPPRVLGISKKKISSQVNPPQLLNPELTYKVNQHMCVAKLEELYCFQYTASNEGLTHKAGWNSFDIQAEFYRQGVPNSHWKMTTINKDYEVCSTYPRYLFVPAETTNHILRCSGKFRSRGRLPVLTYLHKNMVGHPTWLIGGDCDIPPASLTRCSQPLSGFKTRCLEDEEYLQCILRTNPGCSTMYIVDTRPMINAFANRATGKGYEKESHYLHMKFQFSNIENIHVMRSSLQKLIESE
ncbi:MTMR6 [Cordylochernes scorpioides]|uniref:MTMR6 n=1 Tax=Cordylochernes scorpioides TaxID=51811 RepID=A0ABY6K7A2_9ARAC|nr:MTMR6 [Cordylochernes scorpioides]